MWGKPERFVAELSLPCNDTVTEDCIALFEVLIVLPHLPSRENVECLSRRYFAEIFSESKER